VVYSDGFGPHVWLSPTDYRQLDTPWLASNSSRDAKRAARMAPW
jgi:hypothetical protein